MKITANRIQNFSNVGNHKRPLGHPGEIPSSPPIYDCYTECKLDGHCGNGLTKCKRICYDIYGGSQVVREWVCEHFKGHCNPPESDPWWRDPFERPKLPPRDMPSLPSKPFQPVPISSNGECPPCIMTNPPYCPPCSPDPGPPEPLPPIDRPEEPEPMPDPCPPDPIDTCPKKPQEIPDPKPV